MTTRTSLPHAPRGGEERIATTQRVGAVAWPSFFAAGVATMVFFAIVDPVDLASITWPRLEISRELGYTIGFFLFWSCTLPACYVTSLLLRHTGCPRCEVRARAP